MIVEDTVSLKILLSQIFCLRLHVHACINPLIKPIVFTFLILLRSLRVYILKQLFTLLNIDRLGYWFTCNVFFVILSWSFGVVLYEIFTVGKFIQSIQSSAYLTKVFILDFYNKTVEQVIVSLKF